MKVSIITVTYNSEKTLADTLHSVGAQSYKDIEHIIVDGGSKDGTDDIVKKHGVHVARFLSEKDNGIYDAMNKGIALAAGDFVGFLNSDDVLHDCQSIENIVREAKNADIVYGDLEYVSEDDLTQVVRCWKSGTFSRRELKLGWMPPHPTFYARRELMLRKGRFDTTLRIAADYEYMLRFLTDDAVRVGYAKEVLVRMRAGGVSNRSISNMLLKSREDLGAMRRHGVGGLGTLISKNLRKIPQFLARR
jgi:glycosyltransferase